MKRKITNEYFTQAYDDHADAIFRFFYYRVFDRSLAKDLMQDTFTRSWEYLVEGKEIQNIKAFLYRVARNLVVDYSRKKKTLSLDMLQEQGFDPGEDTTDKLRDAIDAQDVIKVINGLDEKYRDVVILRFVDGYKPKEIAKMLEENENVVSVRLHRALKQLRELLDESSYR